MRRRRVGVAGGTAAAEVATGTCGGGGGGAACLHDGLGAYYTWDHPLSEEREAASPARAPQRNGCYGVGFRIAAAGGGQLLDCGGDDRRGRLGMPSTILPLHRLIISS